MQKVLKECEPPLDHSAGAPQLPSISHIEENSLPGPSIAITQNKIFYHLCRLGPSTNFMQGFPSHKGSMWVVIKTTPD